MRQVGRGVGVGAGAAALLLASPGTATAAVPPVAVGDSYRVVQGRPLTVGAAAGLLRNDRDADGSALFAQQLTSMRVGRITLARTGAFTYRPPNSATARYDYFTYRACEVARPAVCSAPVPVRFFLVPAGGRPTGVNDRYVATEDNPLVIPPPGPLVNDRDPEGSRVSLATPSQSTVRGKLITLPSGGFRYEPYDNANGSDYFTYAAIDPAGQPSYPVTVDIDLRPVEDPVQAVPDTATTVEDAAAPVPIPVLANDINVDAGQTLRVTDVSEPTSAALGGVAQCTATECSYRPTAANQFGRDSFTYTVTDGVTTATATVQVVVASVNDAPVARDDRYTTTGGVSIVVPARRGLLANDTDVDGPSGDFLNVGRFGQASSAQNATRGSAGAVYLDNGGTLQFVPRLGFTGDATFPYTIVDSRGATDTASVTVTVQPSRRTSGESDEE